MAVMTLAETAVLPANAVDDSTRDIQTTTTTASTTSTTVENSLTPSTGTSPTLFEYFKKNRVEVVTSTSTERPIQTSPTILQYLQKKDQKDREEAVAIKNKPKEEKKTLLPSFVKKIYRFILFSHQQSYLFDGYGWNHICDVLRFLRVLQEGTVGGEEEAEEEEGMTKKMF